MASDPFGWSKWSPHLSNAISITLGVPAVIGLFAGLWAYLSGSGISIFLVGLAVFMMTLWCVIGFLWLLDRNGLLAKRNTLDCAWGLLVDQGFLGRDLAGSIDGEWQIRLVIRNTLQWPLLIEVTNQHATLENIVSDLTLEYEFPQICMPNVPLSVNFPGYKSGVLPDKDKFKGIIDITIRYGHPDVGFSRTMTRKYQTEVLVKPPAVPMLPWQQAMMPNSSLIPLQLSPRERDRDEPYFS